MNMKKFSPPFRPMAGPEETPLPFFNLSYLHSFQKVRRLKTKQLRKLAVANL
jgi:hypothetical protein